MVWGVDIVGGGSRRVVKSFFITAESSSECSEGMSVVFEVLYQCLTLKQVVAAWIEDEGLFINESFDTFAESFVYNEKYG